MKIPFANKNLRGVAILTVLVSLALLVAVVVELSTKETLRYKLAINERDALMAEALAESGANFAQLILTVQEPIQSYLSNFAKMGVQLPAYTMWDLMPIDSDLLKGITDGAFMPEFEFLSGKKENADGEKKTTVAENNSETPPLYGPYVAPKSGYGGFLGRFSVFIEDEEKKISIRKWPKLNFPQRKMTADQIFRILSKPENRILFDGTLGDNKNISPGQLVGNIYDYISEADRAVDVSAPKESWGRDGVGDKRAPYIDTPNILPKRAPMDSLAELRLVPGMTDAIFQILSKTISIYGESEKINILSASDDILESAFYICDKNRETSSMQQPGFGSELVADWNRKKGEGTLEISAEGIVKHLNEHGIEVDGEECNKLVGTESKTFTIKSVATVGNVTRTLIMRLRSASGIITLYQIQYS